MHTLHAPSKITPIPLPPHPEINSLIWFQAICFSEIVVLVMWQTIIYAVCTVHTGKHFKYRQVMCICYWLIWCQWGDILWIVLHSMWTYSLGCLIITKLYCRHYGNFPWDVRGGGSHIEWHKQVLHSDWPSPPITLPGCVPQQTNKLDCYIRSRLRGPIQGVHPDLIQNYSTLNE